MEAGSGAASTPHKEYKYIYIYKQLLSLVSEVRLFFALYNAGPGPTLSPLIPNTHPLDFPEGSTAPISLNC